MNFHNRIRKKKKQVRRVHVVINKGLPRLFAHNRGGYSRFAQRKQGFWDEYYPKKAYDFAATVRDGLYYRSAFTGGSWLWNKGLQSAGLARDGLRTWYDNYANPGQVAVLAGQAAAAIAAGIPMNPNWNNDPAGAAPDFHAWMPQMNFDLDPQAG